MTECKECQLWEENCICSKCPNCKSKDYSTVRDEFVRKETLQRLYYIKIKIMCCNECFNIFGIEG